jgi:hypothetical protein
MAETYLQELLESRAEAARLNREYGPVPEGFTRCGSCRTVHPNDEIDMWCSCGGEWELSQKDYLGRIRSLAKMLRTSEGETKMLREANANLRGALKPFASAVILPGAPSDGYLSGWLDECDEMPRVSHVEIAREVLKEST